MGFFNNTSPTYVQTACSCGQLMSVAITNGSRTVTCTRCGTRKVVKA